MLLKLTLNSLYARLLTVGMTVFAISLSLMLYMSVEKLRTSAYTSFTDTISQTDLIVGARTSSVQLLLYSVFRIGNATNNITWESYEDVIDRKEVAWSVPISLGDSHKGFRVMGTNNEFFKRYKFRGGQSIELEKGNNLDDLYDVIIGAGVAEKLNYPWELHSLYLMDYSHFQITMINHLEFQAFLLKLEHRSTIQLS